MKISSTLNCTWISSSVRRSSSSTEITDASEDVFIRPLKALPSGGMMVRRACGMTITRIVVVRVMPIARAASNWPRGTAEQPDIERSRLADQLVARHAHKGSEQAAHQSDGHRADRQRQGDSGALDQ